MPGSRMGELELLRGSLTTFSRRCGKPSCHCATGDPHESPALTYTDGGRTKTLTLAGGDVAEVRAALDRYQRAKEALEAQADAGLVALRTRRAAKSSARKA
jgi:hypothetical protein